MTNEKACIASKNMSLDILRIVAALMVLMVHVGQWTGLNKWTDVGAKGVPLFFILSGYLAMVSCHRIFSMDGTVKDYYIGRAKRILPMYYWALFLDYIYSIYMYHSQGLSIPEIFNFFKGPCGIRYIRYVFFLQYVLPSDNFAWWNNRFALWSMSAFAFFYICAPLIYKIFNKFWKIFGVTIFLMLVNSYMINITFNMFSKIGNVSGADMLAGGEPINQLYIFLLGCMVYFVKDEKNRFALGMACLVVAVLTSMQFFGYELIFTACLIFELAFPIININAIAKKILTYLSKFTFCLYLVHPIIIENVSNFVIGKMGLLSWRAFLLIYIVCIIFCAITFEIYTYLHKNLLRRNND